MLAAAISTNEKYYVDVFDVLVVPHAPSLLYPTSCTGVSRMVR